MSKVNFTTRETLHRPWLGRSLVSGYVVNNHSRKVFIAGLLKFFSRKLGLLSLRAVDSREKSVMKASRQRFRRLLHNTWTPPMSSRLSLSLHSSGRFLSFDFHARLEISQMKSVNSLFLRLNYFILQPCDSKGCCSFENDINCFFSINSTRNAAHLQIHHLLRVVIYFRYALVSRCCRLHPPQQSISSMEIVNKFATFHGELINTFFTIFHFSSFHTLYDFSIRLRNFQLIKNMFLVNTMLSRYLFSSHFIWG